MVNGMDVTRMSSKGQIVIPQHIREKLDVVEGDVLGVYEHQGLLVLKKVVHPLTSGDGEAVEHIKRTHGVETSVHRDSISHHPSYIH